MQNSIRATGVKQLSNYSVTDAKCIDIHCSCLLTVGSKETPRTEIIFAFETMNLKQGVNVIIDFNSICIYL